MDIISRAIADRIENLKDPHWQFTSETPSEIDLAVRCAQLGDASGLQLAMQSLAKRRDKQKLDGYEELIAAFKQLSLRWEHVEAAHGDGALLDYEHCLAVSPAHIVGAERIKNACRFQSVNNRVSDDPCWALRYG